MDKYFPHTHTNAHERTDTNTPKINAHRVVCRLAETSLTKKPQVARDYSFEALHVTHSMDTEVTSNPSTTMKQLIPLLQAAMISVQVCMCAFMCTSLSFGCLARALEAYIENNFGEHIILPFLQVRRE